MDRISIWISALLIFGFANAKAQVWQPLEKGLANSPMALTSDRNNLYAAYAIELDGKGGRIFGISVWNGSFWRDLPQFTADSLSTITTLKIYKNQLYIGGKFSSIKGLKNAKNIFRWSGNEYQSITPNEVIQPAYFGLVTDLELFNGKLIISGYFNDMQDLKVSNIVSYNGTKFEIVATNFGTGPNGIVNDVAVIGDSLVLGGAFSQVSGNTSNNIAIFYNGNWKTLKDYNPTVLKIATLENQVFVYNQDTLKKRNVVRLLSGKLVEASKGIDFLGGINDMIAFKGNLIACGSFEINGESGVQSIILYEKEVWRAIKGGTLGSIRVIENFNNNLIAAGSFGYFGNLFLNKIAEYSPDANLITGRIFYDKNNNCQFDNRDENLNDRYVIITPGPYIVKPDENGFYKAFLPSGKYEVNVSTKKYWSIYSECKSQYNLNLAGGAVANNIDFAMQLQLDVSDVKITMTNSGGWRTSIGKSNLYVLTYENIGSNNIADGLVKMKVSKEIVEIKSIPKSDSISDGFIYWKYRNLNSGEIRKIDVFVTVPQIFNQDEIKLEAQISSSQNETSNDDNKDSIVQKVNGFSNLAFDKQVYPSPTYPDSISYISPSTNELQYTISFANFGTDTVRNVYVIDTLDLNIAMQYTQEIGASHPYTTRVISGPPGTNLGILVWTFSNINLKPNPGKASDFIGDKGFISFKVKLSGGLLNGTVIRNRADVIYDLEDYNSTNFVYNKIDKTVGIQTIESSETPIVYPNPFNNAFYISWKNNETTKYVLYDLKGAVIVNGEVMNATEAINVSYLAKGVYVLALDNGKGEVVRRKMVKQ
jgi:hypothetical protein